MGARSGLDLGAKVTRGTEWPEVKQCLGIDRNDINFWLITNLPSELSLRMNVRTPLEHLRSTHCSSRETL